MVCYSAPLARIAESHPRAAYSTLAHGLSSKWHYVFWTQLDVAELLQPLGDEICCTLLPALLGISKPNDTIHNLVALPPWWEGLGIFNPVVLVLRNSPFYVTSQGPYLPTLALGTHLIIST